MISYTPLEYLKIDIANHYGLDKEQFKTRIQWVNDNIHCLESLESEADNKYRFAGAVMALRVVQAFQPTGYLVGLDAASSGPQIMACLMRDAVGAENTCLVGSKRNCVYTKITEAMNHILNAHKTYDRDTIKYVLMPFYYGSKKKPKTVFGEDTDELVAFYQAQAQIVPGASELMPILLNSWNAMAEEHSWVLPDGFNARVKVTQTKEKKIEVDELNHSSFMYQYTVIAGEEDGWANIANPIQSVDGYLVRELSRRCNHDKVQLSRVTSLLRRRLNMTHVGSPMGQWDSQHIMSIVGYETMGWDEVGSMTHSHAKELLRLVERCLSRPSFPVISVHDEFMCHPNYMNYIRLTYMEIMAELSDSTLIDSILTKLYHKPIRVKKMADSISDLILQGEYAIS